MKLFNLGVNPDLSTTAWRELAVFSIYRLLLSALLFCSFYFELPSDFLGKADPNLYLEVSFSYLLLASILVIVTAKRLGRFESSTRIQLVLDIVFITLVINTSGGLQTGLGLLLVVVVIAGGALIPGRLSAFIASIATLSMLLEVSYSQISGDEVIKYSHAGMLGATFFAAALLAQVLSSKVKKTQLQADQSAQEVLKMAVFNQHIISRMQTGILVVDSEGRVNLSNQSAKELLDISSPRLNLSLQYYAPQLAEQLSQWSSIDRFEPTKVQIGTIEVIPRFLAIDSGETLIYIENTAALAQQAQQLKLASLGRLTASIAHEVRNPLGAISHAGELLSELNENDEMTTKLTDIIQRHSARINNIIETILNMSRSKVGELKVHILALWLENFIDEFCELNNLNRKEVNLTMKSSLDKVRMDEQQLHQVMSNLMDNALHYSIADQGESLINVTLFSQNKNVIIEIEDNGQGVSEDMKADLFEPFHSNRQGGTGLGLYLARELCQANGAQLHYRDYGHKHCFQINFIIEQQGILK